MHNRSYNPAKNGQVPLLGVNRARFAKVARLVDVYESPERANGERAVPTGGPVLSVL